MADLGAAKGDVSPLEILLFLVGPRARAPHGKVRGQKLRGRAPKIPVAARRAERSDHLGGLGLRSEYIKTEASTASVPVIKPTDGGVAVQREVAETVRRIETAVA